MILTKRYQLGTKEAPEPLQLDNILPKYKEFTIVAGATSTAIYMAGEHGNCLSKGLRYALPLDKERRYKVSNLNQVFLYADSTGSVTVDVCCEVDE